MNKIKKDNRPMRHNPGVFIDIDGVVLKGGKPFEWSIPAINVKKHTHFNKAKI